MDLVILDMFDYDVIVGMDFLSKFGATINYKARSVNFKPPSRDQFEFNSKRCRNSKMMISEIKASKLLANGCVGFLANVVDTTQKEKTKLEDVPVVSEFVEVFLEELPGIPSKSSGNTSMNLFTTGTSSILFFSFWVVSTIFARKPTQSLANHLLSFIGDINIF